MRNPSKSNSGAARLCFGRKKSSCTVKHSAPTLHTMNPTATLPTEGPMDRLAAVLARAAAMLARHEATKAPPEPPRPPKPKAPRVCRISEAKQGALWVADLQPDQRERAGIADNWKTQAVADLKRLGGIPPAPERRIGRPRKVAPPIAQPERLVTELPGDGWLPDMLAPSMPVKRPPAVEAPAPVKAAAAAVRQPMASIGGSRTRRVSVARRSASTVSFFAVSAPLRGQRGAHVRPVGVMLASIRPARAGPA